MTDEYVELAENFLREHDATVTIEFREEVFNPWDDGKWHNAYDVTIERNGDSFTVDFKDSVYNRERGIEPNCYDVLACLQKYDVGTYEDFCADYGYDVWDEDSLEVYHAFRDEYENVMRLFGDCIDELGDIC